MKLLGLLLGVGCWLTVPLVVLAEEADAPSAMLPVGVMIVGEANDALVARATAWAEENLAIAVPVLATDPDIKLATFNEVAEHVGAQREDDRLGVVVLWRPSSDIMNHGAFFPEQRVAVVNLQAMFSGEADQETKERRVERQVIRGICFCMGLEPNPNPQSAMFNYGTMEELDAIGRNLDPPWLMRLQEKAVASGIPINETSSFNLVIPLAE